MIDYIGVSRLKALLAEIGPARFISELASEIEADYQRWDCFDKSPRHAVHSKDGVIELMPISDGQWYSVKYVNGHPKNTAEGLLTVTAFGVLAEVASGYPVLISELTLTTALRTAAMSALAAKWMARPSSMKMAMIGNGAQSEFQALAFYHLLGIRELRLFDIDQHATRRLERNLKRLDLNDLRIMPCASIAEAVRGSDIVTTCTADKRKAVILTPEMIEPGMHINAIGGDCPGKTELHPSILRRVDTKIVVEFEPQSRIEGEVQQLEAAFPVIEFCKVVDGSVRVRECDADVTVFDSVGFALEDFSALRYLHRLHRHHGGDHAQLDLIPSLCDPKNLFGSLLTESVDTPSARVEQVARKISAC